MNEHLLKKIAYSLLTLLFWVTCFAIGFQYHDFFLVALKQTSLSTTQAKPVVASANAGQEIVQDNTIESFVARSNAQNRNNPLIVYNNNNLCQKIDPAQTYEVKDPSNIYALINKNFYLKTEFVPADLVKLSDLGITAAPGMYLRKEAAEQLQQMNNDMKKLGIKLQVNSAWRSFSNQRSAINYWVKQVGTANAGDYAAQVGFSEHHLGTAVDILAVENNLKTSSSYLHTKLYTWLQDNAYKYGFVESYPQGKEDITGYNFEPWHYRYVGVSAAEEIRNRGITLTEYLYEVNNYCMN